MFLLKLEKVAMEIGGNRLFENVDLEIKENERVALIGENGIGKTTLLKGILGLVPFHSGNIYFGVEKSKIGIMPQDMPENLALTAKEWVMEGHPNDPLKKELDRCAELLAKGNDPNAVEIYNRRLQRYLDAGGYEWEAEMENLLKRFGISEDLWDVPAGSLSGGQKTRLKLAKSVRHSPELLLLDEPTNHLDLETVRWLENWLSRFPGSVLFISHEREFIDHTATVTYELTKAGTKKYAGGYSSYKRQKEQEMKSLQHLYEKQEQERKKLTEAIARYKTWYERANAKAGVRNPYAQKKAAKQAAKFKAKERALERLEARKIEKPEEPERISASLEAADFSGKQMLQMNDVSFSYGKRRVLEKVNLHIARGDRIAVVGKNGSGKTTLLKLLTGELAPGSGTVTRSPQLKIGQFFQELENLHPDRTILDEILSLPEMKSAEARTILACFLFRRDTVYKKIRDLSMGEKCRVAFVKLYFSSANLLVLDEPVNYFDIPARERVEEALEQFPGSIVLVAHDPYLLRKVSNKVVHIENGKAAVFSGGYAEWENRRSLSPSAQILANEWERLKLQYEQLITQESGDPEEEEERMKQLKRIQREMEQLRKTMDDAGS